VQTGWLVKTADNQLHRKGVGKLTLGKVLGVIQLTLALIASGNMPAN